MPKQAEMDSMTRILDELDSLNTKVSARLLEAHDQCPLCFPNAHAIDTACIDVQY